MDNAETSQFMPPPPPYAVPAFDGHEIYRVDQEVVDAILLLGHAGRWIPAEPLAQSIPHPEWCCVKLGEDWYLCGAGEVRVTFEDGLEISMTAVVGGAKIGPRHTARSVLNVISINPECPLLPLLMRDCHIGAGVAKREGVTA